ncbi:copper chaperone PCu(A)C [Pigmentiphaga litoralis]|uniref:copper chaperone PCu(A)C n=1 Tax=Pigmentiphaga litoralis TaxID=516702 RepID=UPI003B43AFE4
MTLRTLTLTALLLGALSTSAFAHGYKAGEIDIGHPWARATVPGQPAGGGFLKLDNHGKDDRLLAVRSDVSATAEIHTMEMKDNIMRMRQVEGVAVPAGKTVEFAPGGYHIMFMQLKAPLKQGTTFPATLVFEKAGEVKVDFKVEAINFGAQGKAAAGGHQHH